MRGRAPGLLGQGPRGGEAMRLNGAGTLVRLPGTPFSTYLSCGNATGRWLESAELHELELGELL